MSERVDFSEKVQDEILLRSARRCALCHGLDGSLRRVEGQIAHVDRDSANAAPENAAFLCLRHHNEYDTRPSQSKGFKPGELTAYRERLYAAIEKGEHITTKPTTTLVTAAPPENASPQAHDRAIFLAHEEAFPEDDIVFLLSLINSDQPFDGGVLDRCAAFAGRVNRPSNQFVSRDLQQRAEAFAEALHKLWVFIELKGSRYADGRATSKYVSKSTPHAFKSDGVLYVEHVKQLNPLSAAVSTSYGAYRHAVKQTLFM